MLPRRALTWVRSRLSDFRQLSEQVRAAGCLAVKDFSHHWQMNLYAGSMDPEFDMARQSTADFGIRRIKTKQVVAVW